MKELFERIIYRKKNEKREDALIMGGINNALEEISLARSRFNMASGEDNVELAIYELTAAEMKYRNLLREAKRSGFVFPDLFAQEEVDENKCS